MFSLATISTGTNTDMTFKRCTNERNCSEFTPRFTRKERDPKPRARKRLYLPELYLARR